MKKTSFSFGGVKPSAPKRAAVPAASTFEDAPELPAEKKQSPVDMNSENADEVDPLDAFMSGMAKKTTASKPKQKVHLLISMLLFLCGPSDNNFSTLIVRNPGSAFVTFVTSCCCDLPNRLIDSTKTRRMILLLHI